MDFHIPYRIDSTYQYTMEHQAREHLGILMGAVQNVSNIQAGVCSMILCRLNSLCAHMDHTDVTCPLYKKVRDDTRKIARPMFDYAKEMLAKAVERFRQTHDTMMEMFPPQMSDQDVWKHSIRTIEGGNSLYNVEETLGLAAVTLRSEL